MLDTVVKRDGRDVDYNSNNVRQALIKAFEEVDGIKYIDFSDKTKKIIEKIVNEITNVNEHIMSVENIQDLVELKLMASARKDVAKAYILYRDNRTKIRDRNSKLVRVVMDRVNTKVDNHANANVDEKSFSGREKEASADIGKLIALDYGGLSDEVAKAHKEMLIYQHDLEKAIYGVHNCLNLNFQEIFTYGFRTRNGDVRPPSSFSTACQLVAVAFQCQSQVQFGGVGTIHLDYDLAPFVKKSFYKHYEDGCKYIGQLSEDETKEIITTAKEKDLSIDDEYFKFDEQIYQYAMDMLEKEGEQAAQGLYHNLNTLESRQGSQVKCA